MNRYSKWVLSLLAVAVLASVSATAQVMRHSGGEDGELLILNELGIVAGPGEDKGLEVMTLLPDTESKRDVEIKRGDQLLMIGGKRIKDVAALRVAYQGTEVGDTLKLGFRRGDQRFMVSFEKQAEQQGGRRVVMMAGGPGEAGDLQPLMEFGAVLSENDGKIVVGMEIPGRENSLAKDDVVTAINGKTVDTVAAFREIYDALAIGDTMDLVFSRAGKEQTMSRPKAEARGAVRMRQAP